MLHSLACAAIAYCLSLYVNARWPNMATAIWSGPASVIAGLVLGSALVIGGLSLAGVTMDAGQTIDRLFGQTLIWTAAGAAAGIYLGRKKGLTGTHEDVGSIPTRAWLGWGALTVVSFIVVAGLIGQAIPQKQSVVAAPAVVQPAAPQNTIQGDASPANHGLRTFNGTLDGEGVSPGSAPKRATFTYEEAYGLPPKK